MDSIDQDQNALYVQSDLDKHFPRKAFCFYVLICKDRVRIELKPYRKMGSHSRLTKTIKSNNANEHVVTLEIITQASAGPIKKQASAGPIKKQAIAGR